MKLGALLSDNARRTPDKICVICEDKRITFAEIDARSNRIANALLDRGIAIGDRVAVYMPNSITVAEALAGVIKTGSLVVPISTRLTADEVSYIINHSEPKAIFFPASHRETALGAIGEMPGMIRICVGATEAGESEFEEFTASGSETQPPALPAQPDDCVIGYTSGTTGKPKGAVGTHSNLIVGGFIHAREWELRSDDVVFATTPMAHRTGLSRLASSFQFDTPVVMQPRFDAENAVELIEREGITIMGCVPTIVRMMLPHIEERPEADKTLRLVSATGELFPEVLRKRLFAAAPHVGLYSFLAQTEGGVLLSVMPQDQDFKPKAMGAPIPGVEIKLVDENLKEVAQGENGEILVRCGEPGQYTVMREYFRNPQATREAFTEDGWFRTGDVGYGDEDGYYYFADRAKDMIVTGGLNVYSKEVELALLDHAAVDDAAVYGVPDQEFGEAIMACIQLKPGGKAEVADMIEHCRERIASYKKPKHVRFIDELPRTSSGKILKYQLKQEFAAENEPSR